MNEFKSKTNISDYVIPMNYWAAQLFFNIDNNQKWFLSSKSAKILFHNITALLYF